MSYDLFVRQDGGDNSNSGEDYINAFANVNKALEYSFDNGAPPDGIVNIMVFKGEYVEDCTDWNQPLDDFEVNIYALGDVKFENKTYDTQSYSFLDCTNQTFSFHSIYFKIQKGSITINNGKSIFFDKCILRPAVFNDIDILMPDVGCLSVYNGCTVYGFNNPIDATSSAYYYNSIIQNCSNVVSTGLVVSENVASDSSVIVSATNNPIDTNISGNEPPFTDVSIPDAPDLRFNNNHANYNVYMNSGSFGKCVGCKTTEVIGWNKKPANASEFERYYGIALNEGMPLGEWFNDENFISTTWEDKEITTGSNDEIEITEHDGTSIVAVIPQGTYSTKEDYATAIETALNNESSNTYKCYINNYGKLVMSSDDTSFSLLCSSGLSASPAWSHIGFDTVSDKTGYSIYESDHFLFASNPGSTDKNRTWCYQFEGDRTVKTTLLSSGSEFSARMVSDVISLGYPTTLKGANKSCVLDCIGKSKSVNSIKVFVRASNAQFDKFDPYGTTQVEWTELQDGFNGPSIVSPFSYYQYAVEITLT